jgi:hypothetical protein
MLAGTLEIEMLANMARLSKDMDDAKRSVTTAMSAIEKSVAVAKAALGGLAAGLSTQALVAYTQRLIDAADAMNDMSQRVGIAVKDLAKYELAAAQSGTSMESVAKGIKDLAANMLKHGDALKNAGITATTADAAMQQLADVFAAMPDGVEKTTLATEALGKSGMDLIPMLNLGSKGLADAADKSAAYAKEMSAAAPLADAFNDNLAHLAMSSKAVGMTLLNEALPSLTKVATALAAMDTKPAVDAVMTVAGAVVPAAKVAGAYFAIFVAAPAVYAMTTAALTPLIHATALHAYNMITGEAATIGLNTSLYGTSVAAQLAAGSLSKMALAGSVLFAAFAGWQFGTYLRDQFVEVRVAGLAFIGAMMSGWEHLTYGAQLAGAALKSLLPGTESFANAQARLSAQHAANIAVIDQNIIELIQYETSVKSATAAESASADAKGKVSQETKKLLSDLSGTKAAVDEATKGLAKYNELMDKSAGFDKSWADTARQLRAALDGKKISQEQFNAAILEAYKNQPIMVAAEKAAIDAAKLNTDAVDDLFDAQEKLRTLNEDQIKTARTTLEQIEFETQLLGLNTAQRAQATLERELERQGIVKGTQAYDAYIVKLREATAIKEAKEAGIESAKDLADANRKAAEESSRYWEDALTRAFESGKSGWQSLWSTIKNTLQTQVLKIFLAPVVGGVSGMANAATGSGGASPFAAYGNPFTNFSGSMGNSIADFGTSMVDKGFTSLGTGIENLGLSLNANAPMVNAFGDALGYATALMAASEGKWGQAAGAAIGTYFGGPIGSAIGSAIGGMVDELFGGGGGPKTESGYGYSIGGPGNVDRLVGGATGSAAVYAKGIEDGWAALASKFGLASSLSVGAFTSTDPEGDALTQVQVAAGLDGQSVYSRADRLGGTANIGNVGRTPEELAAALQEESVRVLFSALKASNLDGEYTAYFASIGDSVAEMTAALDTVVLIKDFRTAMDSLPFAYLRDLSFDAAKGLLQAAGGLQAFGTNLSGFYDNFYAESEKTSNLTRNVTDALAAQNIVLPQVDTNLRAWYRSEVERLGAMDLSIAANAQAYASVLALQGSVAQLATGAEAAAKAVADAAARLQADIISAQDSAMSDYMSAQADYASIIAAEQESAAQSMQAAAAATTQAAEAIRSAMASAGQGIATLIRDLTTNAGGTLDPMALMRSTQRAYLADLSGAQGGNVEASARIAASARAYLDASGAVSGNNRQAATVAQVVAELGALPAVKTYEQQLLDAVNGISTTVTTSGTTNTADLKAALATKLTAELTLDARAEILKIINLTVTDSNLTPEQKALALLEAQQIDKLIKLSANNLFSETDQLLALATTGTVAKTFTAALGAHDLDAMAIAYAQSNTIEKIIRASGGVLTLDQQTLLNGITDYNKDIQIGVKIDSSELSAFQQTLMSIFGTMDITGLAAAGVDLSGVISNEALARLQSVNAYVQGFDWVNTDLATRASQMHAVRTTAIAYGVSSQDVATAIGVSKSELASWYEYLNVPFFATGGMHAGGLRIVGENGPELEATGPSRIYNAADTMAMLRNPQANSDALVAEIRRLNATNEALERRLAAIERNTQVGAVHQADSADSLRNLKNNGVQVWTDPAEPIKTEAV